VFTFDREVDEQRTQDSPRDTNQIVSLKAVKPAAHIRESQIGLGTYFFNPACQFAPRSIVGRTISRRRGNPGRRRSPGKE
jgi:hypothetical protein